MDTKKCNKCGKVEPLPEMDRRRDKKTGEFKYLSCCKSCKAEYQNQYIRENREIVNLKQRERWAKKQKEKRTGVKQEPCKPVPTPPKPSVWDLTVMPKISVEHTVQIANEAFPLLDNQYWKTGEAQKIYKQFGRKWSYL